MAISQIVDDQIKQIRKERAELDELRASLEKRDESLRIREKTQDDDVGVASDKKEQLEKEIADLTKEVELLRAQRDSSVENFGGEISKIHAEKSAESAAQAKQLQGEINFLLKGKTELETELEALREKLADMEKKAKTDLERVTEDKKNAVKRARDEREAELKEINLAHSVAVAELDRQKKELENEITALEQAKTIEWNKIQAEVARYKTAQLGEADAKREELLAEIEREKNALETSLRDEERKRRAEISAEKREWEKEILKYQVEKQKILDEIKTAEYEYENVKAGNVVKAEKARLDLEKELEATRAAAAAAHDEETALAIAEAKKSIAEAKKQARDELDAIEKELVEAEIKKAAILSEITALDAKFETARAENAAALEAIRLDRLAEIDDQRVQRLAEIESLRQDRISALETAFLQKSSYLEEARAQKLEECRAAIKTAEASLAATRTAQIAAEKEVETLHAESERIKEENEALKKAAIVEKQLELEKLANDKLTEVETLCAARISAADEKATKIAAASTAADEKLSADIAHATETLLELRRSITAQSIELSQKRDEKLEEIEKATLDTLEAHAKLKMEKLAEIEDYLTGYKNERLRGIQEDIARQSKANYKSFDELAAMNDDLQKRTIALQERELAIETDMRVIEFKNKQIAMLQERNLEIEMYLAQREAAESGEKSPNAPEDDEE